MKWGVRRYQNADGTYTKAGLKRYNNSLSEYEKANARYKNAKQNKADKTEKTQARLARTKAKKRLEKDYKHLKQDKLADEGKELYSKGKTIRSNNKANKVLKSIGAISLLSAAKWGPDMPGGKKVQAFLAAAGVTVLSTTFAKEAINESQNKRLRAYYSHTSKY